jgi:hypothetical protein
VGDTFFSRAAMEAIALEGYREHKLSTARKAIHLHTSLIAEQAAELAVEVRFRLKRPALAAMFTPAISIPSRAC